MPDPDMQTISDGVVFTVKVVPGSSRTAIAGLLDRAVKVKVAAPAEKGKANEHLLDFLAKQLGVRRNTVTIVSGATSALKRVCVMGISAQELSGRLGLK